MTGSDRLLMHLRLLHDAGVKSYKGPDDGGELIEVEFFERQQTEAVDISKVAEEMKCPCGHEEHCHNDEGQCLLGCDAEMCAPPGEVK